MHAVSNEEFNAIRDVYRYAIPTISCDPTNYFSFRTSGFWQRKDAIKLGCYITEIDFSLLRGDLVYFLKSSVTSHMFAQIKFDFILITHFLIIF